MANNRQNYQQQSIIGNALSCRTVETASTVSTKYAILSEKHEWDSRQYPPRVNAHTHLLPSRDKSSGSWTSFTLCQTLLCQQFSVADFPSPPAFHFRPAGKVVERINLILQRRVLSFVSFANKEPKNGVYI